MTVPRTYAEWLNLLDRFKAGENDALSAMQLGTIEWTSVVADRWTQHIVDCLNTRLQSLSDQLQRSLNRAAGDHLAIGNSMLLARRGLEPLRAFVALPAIPQNVHAFLAPNLEMWAEETQRSLERHASLVRHDQGRLLKTIREHPLNVKSVTIPTATSQGSMPQAPKGRRVIL